MRLAGFVLQSNRQRLVLAVLTAVASGFAGAGLMAYIGSQFNSTGALGAAAIVAFVALVVFALATGLAARWILVRLVSHRTLELQFELARRFVATPLARIETIGAPKVFAVMTEDARLVSMALVRIPMVVISLALLAGCFAYLVWLSPLAAGVLLVTAAPVIVLYRLLHRRVTRLLEEFFKLRDDRYTEYEALTAGAKELQMSRPLRERFLSRHVERTGHRFRDSQEEVIMAHEVANSWSQSAYFIFVLALLVLIRYEIIEADILGAYALIALYMRTAVVQLTAVVPEWTQANAALDRIDALELAPAPAPDDDADRPRHTDGGPDAASNGSGSSRPIAIEACDLTYRYPDTDRYGFTLGPLDATLNAGEVVFITGGNGSGKTTFMKVLCSLYEPTGGSLRCNGRLVEAGEANWYRDQISALFADGYLFEELAGIDDGSDEATDAADRYLRELDLIEKVSAVDGRFSTTRLSTGERRRLALLGAFLQDRPVYAFDEWAANQDPVFKRVFYRVLLPDLKRRNKLVIVISHDDTYFDAADRILHLADGRLAEPTPLD